MKVQTCDICGWKGIRVAAHKAMKHAPENIKQKRIEATRKGKKRRREWMKSHGYMV